MTEQNTPKMTHDEMIDVLKGLVFGTFDRTTAKEREALDMAIKALDICDCLNPCAITPIEGMIDISNIDTDQCKWWVNHLFSVAKEQACNSHNFDDAEEIQSAQDKIVKVLEQESSKTEWIPVKDNPPAVGKNVLLCDLDGDMYVSYLHAEGKWGFDYGGDKIKNIIAWQPLPKPYKESEE